jgi:hypothetical protein
LSDTADLAGPHRRQSKEAVMHKNHDSKKSTVHVKICSNQTIVHTVAGTTCFIEDIKDNFPERIPYQKVLQERCKKAFVISEEWHIWILC